MLKLKYTKRKEDFLFWQIIIIQIIIWEIHICRILC
nr:MAG TPA: hypothetical protein [Caudoviricetes sp.]